MLVTSAPPMPAAARVSSSAVRFALSTALPIPARQRERHSSLDLQIVPADLAIAAEEFVPCDLTLHRALVDSLYGSRLGVDRPDPVHEMPRPFMTEHQQVRVAGRELDMIEPGVLLVERPELARLDMDREQGVRDLGFEDPGEILGLVGIRLQDCPLRFSRAHARQSRLVGIERRDAPLEVRGKDVDEAGPAAVDVGSKNTVSALVEHFSPLRGNDLTENVPPMVGQLFDLQSFEIDGKELSPVGCR